MLIEISITKLVYAMYGLIILIDYFSLFSETELTGLALWELVITPDGKSSELPTTMHEFQSTTTFYSMHVGGLLS